MPSPFPGMDPYFESDLWTSFHAEFAVGIARHLSPLLRPHYFALTQKRTLRVEIETLEAYEASFFPDVGVVEDAGTSPVSTGGPAVMARAPFETTTQLRLGQPHFWVEIRDTKKRRLVTAIEILSPANKEGRGYRQYLKKRGKLLRSKTHLLEIDLLRRGKRMPTEDPLPLAAYFIFLHRVERRPVTEIWPIRLQDALPTVPVPLLGPESRVDLALQAVFNDLYDAFFFGDLIDYRESPTIPLSLDDAAWSDQLLKSAGKR